MENSLQPSLCEGMDWNRVQEMTEPFLSEDLYTAFEMQGLSLEYKPSAAADVALTMGVDYPDSVQLRLESIRSLCD